MDEGRKRVIGIMAAILASLHMQTADDLFGRPSGSPRTDQLIAASIIECLSFLVDPRCKALQTVHDANSGIKKEPRRPGRVRDRGTRRDGALSLSTGVLYQVLTT